MDPWRDYLAIPIAPLVLVVQFASLFDRRGWRRLGVSLGCTAAVAAMFFYVESIPLRATEGANIGAGVLLLWLLLSVLLLLAGGIRDLVAALVRRTRRAR